MPSADASAPRNFFHRISEEQLLKTRGRRAMRWSIMAATLAAAVTSEGCALTEWLGLDDRLPESAAREASPPALTSGSAERDVEASPGASPRRAPATRREAP